jgi:endonuclease-3 related protein
MSALTADLLKEVYQRLYAHFGPQNWWPGDTPFEVMIGAVLTQNTAWGNVEKAVAALKSDAFSPESLYRMPEEDLARKIRPCGYFRVKARRLKNLLAAVQANGNGCLDVDRFLSLPTAKLRHLLLSVSGVGPETADSILLYAALRPVFVVDAYTRRALSRHGWIEPDASYDDIQRLFMSCLPHDANLFNEYHALWVMLGKTYCRPGPRCSGCPLEGFE